MPGPPAPVGLRGGAPAPRLAPSRALLVAFVLGLGALAGCVESPASETHDLANAATCVPGAQAIPFGAGHDHNDPAQHRLACNARVTAADDLRQYGWTPETVVGAHAADLAGDLLAVGVNAGETEGGQQGFHLFDVAQPAHPVHVGYYDSKEPVGGDRTIAFSGDGKTVYLGYEGDARPGVAAIDVSDPAHPKERAFWSDPQGYGSHTIGTGVIGGTQYVFALALGVNILRDDGTQLTLVGKYLATDQLAALDALGSSTGVQTYAVRSLYGHDMSFYADPVEGGRSLLFVAYAYEGLKVLDLSQPSVPVLIGRWMPPADTTHRHYTHSVAAERGADGKLLLVVGSETFEAENQAIASPVWILDATATVAGRQGLALLGPDPVQVSTWRNPSDAPAGNLGLSVHFFRLHNGTLDLSHYHGGVWRVPLRTADERARPTAIGYAMGITDQAVRPPSECCIGFDLSGAPMVFDVVANGDVVYVIDEAQGVVAIQYEGVAATA